MSDTVTETTAPTFRERISGLKRKELVAIAKEEFQLNVDSNVDADKLKDVLIRHHEDRVTSAMEANQKASRIFLEANPDEKLLKVRFHPQDFPNAPLKFPYDGGYGIRDPKNPARNPTGLSRVPIFNMIPGEAYELPITVIKHLQSLVFMDSKPQFDPVTQMIFGNIPVIKPRFLLSAVFDDQVFDELGTRELT